MKLDRLIGILSILLHQEKVTMPYLAETFEVSRRTIHRDIETLCRAGIPITTSQGSGGGVSIMSGYQVDHALLASQGLQVLLAAPFLIDLASWYRAPLSGKIGLLQEAISTGREVRFHYYSPSGESDRTIEPYHIVFQWGAWYLWGWCQTRGDYRLFKLNRMTGLHLGEAFAKRAAPYPDLSDQRVFPACYQVEALVPAKYKWLLVEEYGENSFTAEPDGRCRFSLPFTYLDSAVDWLLRFHGEAEVLGPEELREALCQIGEKLAEKDRRT